MTRRAKLIGWFLYRLREHLIERVGRLHKRTDRINGWVDRLDQHEGERYWRKRDRGI